jgi:ATP-dependent DNA helicase RecG
MCSTNDGFKIAERDLELRGPGDIEGTRQSGALNLKLASLVDDRQLVAEARLLAEQLIEHDEKLQQPENAPLKAFLNLHKGKTVWSKIS